MPEKRSRRKRSSRRRRYKRRKMTVQTGFPNFMYVKLEYAAKIALQSVGGTPMVHTFRGNSIYDPDYTGVGNQPYYRDQLATLYEKYVVTGSKLAVKFVSDNEPSFECIVRPSDTATTPSDFDLSRMRPDTRSAWVDNQKHAKISYYRSTPSMLKKSRSAIMSDDEYQFEFNADTNPQNEFAWFWHVGVRPVSSSTTMTVYAYCHLTYYVKVFAKKLVGTS